MSSSTSDLQSARSESREVRLAGDLIVTFGVDDLSAQGRGGARSVRARGEEDAASRLWEFETTSEWIGYPLRGVSDGNTTAWILGETYAESDPVGSILQVLGGQRSPATLNGHFLLIGYDGNRREWTFITDRFGTVHAYYGTRGNRTAVGTYFPAVAAAVSRRELDWLGLSGFFGMGFFPDDRTFYDDVKVLKPASRYVFNEGGALVGRDRYWSWPVSTRRHGSGAEALEAFGETFLEVMREMMDGGRIAIPISGGLDSRSTVAAVNPEQLDGDRLWSFSYGYGAGSMESAIGSQVAGARGLAHATYQIRPYLFERLGTVLDSVEGFQDITQCRQAAVAGEIAEHADWLIAAHWGDVWMDSAGLGSERIGDGSLADLAQKKMWKSGGDWLVEHLCEPRLGTGEPRNQIRRLLATQLADIPQDHEPDFRLKALKTETWACRWTLASLRMYQTAAFPRLPFFDTRVTDILSAVPSSLFAGRQLQIDFLKRYAPDLARIKWQPYDANLYAHHRFDSWHLPKRAMKKALRELRGDRPIERNWEIQLLGEPGESGLENWLLRKGLRLHDLVAEREVEILLDRFRAPDRDPALGHIVSMLLTFSAWLELHG